VKLPPLNCVGCMEPKSFSKHMKSVGDVRVPLRIPKLSKSL